MNIKRRTFFWLTASPVLPLVSGCGKGKVDKEVVQKEVWSNISLAEAILSIFDVVSIAIPAGRAWKFSYALGSGALNLEKKLEKLGVKAELSFKLPIIKSRSIKSKDDLIAELQEKLNYLKKRIIDDETILLVIRNESDVNVIPIKRGESICCMVVQGCTVEISNKASSKLIQIHPFGGYSEFYVGDCVGVNDYIRYDISIDENSEHGDMGVFEYLDASDVWVNVGGARGAVVVIKERSIRVRLKQNDEVLWDGRFDESDLLPGCRSFKIIPFIGIESSQARVVPCPT